MCQNQQGVVLISAGKCFKCWSRVVAIGRFCTGNQPVTLPSLCPHPSAPPPISSSTMLYCSTRGGVRGRDFREVLFSGYAPDGGMFMPETLPAVSPETLRSWRGLQYRPLVVEVSSLFIPAQLIPREDLEGEQL